MKVLGKIMTAFQALPYLMAGVEAIKGAGKGKEKKEAVLGFTELSLGISEMVAGKEIVDEKLFREGMDQVMEGQLKIAKAIGMVN